MKYFGFQLGNPLLWCVLRGQSYLYLEHIKGRVLLHIYHETWGLIQTKFCIVPLHVVYRNNYALHWKYTVWYYSNDFTDIRRVYFNTRYNTHKNMLAHEHVCVWSVHINTVCLQMPRRLSTLAVSYRAAVGHSSPPPPHSVATECLHGSLP